MRYIYLLCVFVCINSIAQTQFHDNTFATNGIYSYTSPYGNSNSAIIESGAITGNNKIIISGNYRTISPQYPNNENTNIITRLNIDGSVDTSFNTFIRIPQFYNTPYISGYEDLYLNKIVLQNDGKILLGDIQFRTLIRLNENGTLDTGFATNGTLNLSEIFNIVNSNGLTYGFLRKIIVVNNKILVCFDSQTNPSPVPSNPEYKQAVIRFNNDGSLDTTFASNGILTQNGSRGNLLLQNSKLILLSSDSNTDELTVKRYSLEGQQDMTFNNGVLQITPTANYTPYFYSYNITDNSIIMSGIEFSSVGELPKICLVKLSPDGVLDTSFGSNGLVEESYYPSTVSDYWVSSNSLFQDLLIDQNNNLYYVTNATPTSSVANYNHYIKKFTSNGVVDLGFGNNGIIEVDLSGAEGYRSSIIQNDGKIITFGTANSSSKKGIAVRLLNNSSLSNVEVPYENKMSELIIYPNPTVDFINIVDNGLVKNIEIIDNSGKIILKTITKMNKINVGFLPNGLYQIKVNHQSKTFIKN